MTDETRKLLEKAKRSLRAAETLLKPSLTKEGEAFLWNPPRRSVILKR